MQSPSHTHACGLEHSGSEHLCSFAELCGSGGGQVTKAVMSVPAEFDAAQRDATMAAGKMAGLDVLRVNKASHIEIFLSTAAASKGERLRPTAPRRLWQVINEPTAAAMAYGLNKKNGTLTRGLILVFDFGGGTLDVSLLVRPQPALDAGPTGVVAFAVRLSCGLWLVQGLEHGVFHTLAIAGNAHLGGEDFTQTLCATYSPICSTRHTHRRAPAAPPKQRAQPAYLPGGLGVSEGAEGCVFAPPLTADGPLCTADVQVPCGQGRARPAVRGRADRPARAAAHVVRTAPPRSPAAQPHRTGYSCKLLRCTAVRFEKSRLGGHAGWRRRRRRLG